MELIYFLPGETTENNLNFTPNKKLQRKESPDFESKCAEISLVRINTVKRKGHSLKYAAVNDKILPGALILFRTLSCNSQQRMNF
jgi:hypothetical protein